MPILKMLALPQAGLHGAKVQAALSAACQAIADAMGVDEKHVWATWSELPAGHYVEGGRAADTQPADTHPPIGELLCFQGRSPEQIRAGLQAAADALGEHLGLGANIFIAYREVGPGEVIDAGEVR